MTTFDGINPLQDNKFSNAFMLSHSQALIPDKNDQFALARQLKAAIWVYDIDHKKIVHANEAACQLWQASSETELKQRDLSVGMTQTVSNRLKLYQVDFETAQSRFHENWTLFPKGSPVTIDVVYSGFRLPDGRMGMLCEALGKSELTSENLRSLKALFHTDVAVGLFNLDGSLLYQNPAARALSPHADMTLADFFVCSKDYETCRLSWVMGKDTHTVSKIHTSKGEVWFDLTVKVSLDAVTGETALLATGVDITKLKIMETRVEAKQRLLEASFASSHEGIIIFDTRGHILETNAHAEDMFGFQRENVIGHDMADFIIPARYKDLHYRSLARVTSQEGRFHNTFRTEIEAMRINGEEFMSELSISRSRSVDGDIFVAYIKDISEAKAAEQALIDAKQAAEEANIAKTAFLANMSHEIRTPMNGVLGLLNVLQRTELTDEQMEYTNIISRSGNTLLNILSDILDLSKIESGKLQVDAEPCDLKKIIRNSVDLFSASANEKGLILKSSYEDNLPSHFIVDANRVQQIMSNLIGNAIKFTPHGSINIEVRGQTKNGHTDVEITVTDTGIGIEEKKLDLIFDAFTQAENSTTREYGGTGLGLSISRQLAEAMKGTLSVSSQLGVGTSFKLKLPLRQANNVKKIDVKPIKPKVAMRNARNNKSRLSDKLDFLIVEDDDINCMVIKAYLEHPKINLSIAKTGLEAVELCRKQEFDMIFMDVSMPVMSGIDATQIIRDEERKTGRRPAPIICVTAHAMESDREDFLKAGMDDYLTKPLRKKDLLQMVKKWLTHTKLQEAA